MVAEHSKMLLQNCSLIANVTKGLKADEGLFREIEEIREIVNKRGNSLVEETFTLRASIEKFGLYEAIKGGNLLQIATETKNYLEEAYAKFENILSKTEVLKDAKEHRQKKINGIWFTAWFLIMLIMYVIQQYLDKEIPFDSLQFIGWLFISAISLFIYFSSCILCTILIIKFFSNFPNKIGLKILIIICMVLIRIVFALVNYVSFYFLPHKLFILSLPILKSLSQPNSTIVVLLNLATFLGFLALIPPIIWYCKFIKKQIDKVFNS